MITDKQIEEMLDEQKKIPLLRRALGCDLPELPQEAIDIWEGNIKEISDRLKIDMDIAKERFPFAFMEAEELFELLSSQSDK